MNRPIVSTKPGSTAAKAADQTIYTHQDDLFALEERMMFDGAAGAELADTLADVGAVAAEDVTAEESEALTAASGLVPAESDRSIFFIAPGLNNADALIAQMPDGAEIVFLQDGADGVAQIADVLDGREGLDAVHILSHGREGQLVLADAVLNAASISGDHAEDLARIGAALSETGDILIYGCDFTGGAAGEEAARLLSAATGADVAASEDITGHGSFGGDWDLETEVGVIEAEALAAETWLGRLPVVDTDGDGVNDDVDLDDDNDGILDTVENEGAAIGNASGTGANTDTFYWINWGADFADGIQPGDVNTFTLSDGSVITLTVTAANADAANYAFSDLQTWGGSQLAPVYNTAGTSEALYATVGGLSAQVTFSVSAVDVNGVAFAPDILFSDPETTDTGETNTMVTDGSAWRLVEQVGTFTATGLGTQTFQITNTQSGVPIVRSDSVSELTWSVTPTSGSGGLQAMAFGIVRPTDTDGDSVPDHLDIDTDNDGITDNVEAQTTAGYLAPSGQAGAMIDADNDGLDDRYDSDTSGAAGSVGLTPVDTDSDSTADYLDDDSDGDGTDDIAERGDGAPTSITSTLDTDSDGLLDIFEGGNANDGFDVNDGNVLGDDGGADGDYAGFGLSDTDADTNANSVVPGRTSNDASALVADLSFRDLRNDADTDGDGVLDTVDVDDDNDGVLDVNEGLTASIGTNEDFEAPFNSVASGFNNLSSAYPAGTSPVENYVGTAGFLSGPNVNVSGLNFLDAFSGSNYIGLHSGGDYAQEIASIDLTTNISAGEYYGISFAAYLMNLGSAAGGSFQSPGTISILGIVEGSTAGQAAIAPSSPATSTATVAAHPDVDLLGTTDVISSSSAWSEHLIGFVALRNYDTILIVPNDEGNGRGSFIGVDLINVGSIAGVDSDLDGIDDHLDIDRDNDGITDNVEAQTTSGYVAPSGSGAGLVDVDSDGLDDNYDSDTSGALGSEGLTQVDTDGDGTVDTLDDDSDGDGTDDIAERGDGASEWLSSITDTDGDGLVDIFEGSDDNDGFDSNDENVAGDNGGTDGDYTALALGDADDDTNANEDVPGRTSNDAVAQSADVDFRDALDDTDTDGDGVVDRNDVDDDNDGILDALECTTTPGGGSGISGALPAGQVSFDITSSDPTAAGGTHVLDAIVISGTGNADVDGRYEDLIVPDRYEGEFNLSSGSLVEQNGLATGSDFLTDPNFDDNILPAFQSRNLGLFQRMDGHDFSDDAYRLYYNTPIESRVGGFFAVTERNGNNSTVIEAFDVDGNSLGTVTARANQDYVDSGHASNIGSQNVEIAVFAVDDLAAIGAEIAYLEVTFGPGATTDGPDGKVFFFYDGVPGETECDTDGDGVVDRLDIDADNDGITDNVEAQTTAGYIAPSGTGVGITDVNGDGLDDAFDNRGSGLMAGDAAATVAEAAFSPVDSDGDGTADMLDADSDNDGVADIAERGDGAPTSETSSVDTDGDGLLDIFEGGNANDAYDVNDENVAGDDGGTDGDYGRFDLADTDEDTNANEAVPGRVTNDASATNNDLDFRDDNLPPDAVNDALTTVEDTTLNANVITPNDTDPEGDTLSITAAELDLDDDGNPDALTLGTPTQVLVGGASIGTLTLTSAGALTFAPAANFNGSVPKITYTLSDGNGHTDTADVAITVTPVADPPVAVNDGPVAVAEDTPATGSVLANDSDPDGDPITVTEFTIGGTTYPAGTTATLTEGTLVINTDGSYTFTPAANYTGPVPPATYVISDGALTDTAVLSFADVTPVNDDPVDGDESNNTPEDTTLTVADGPNDLLANTTDPDGGAPSVTGYTVAGYTGPAPVIGTPLTLTEGTLTINANGSYSFAPAPDFNGTVPAITYTVSDGAGGSDTSTLSLNVTPVNDTPSDGNETNSTPEDTTLTVADGSADDLLTNASDPDGDTLTITGFTIGGTNYAPGATASLTEGTLVVNANGSYTFTPAPNFNGSFPQVTYTVEDPSGASTVSTLDLTITPVNDAPVDGDETNTLAEDTPLTVADGPDDLLANTTDLDGGAPSVTGYTVAGYSGPAPVIGTPLTLTEGTLTINANGSYSFAPAPNFNGAVPVITYTVDDGAGGTDTSTLTLNVTPVNDPPDAVNDGPVAVTEDTPATGNVLGNDSDPENDPLVVTRFTVGGTTYPAGTSVTLTEGTLVINPDGSFTFTPVADYNGPVPPVTYEITDGSLTDTAVLSFADVTPVNDAPVDGDETDSTRANTPLVVADGSPEDLLANASDADGDTLVIRDFTVGGTTYPAGTPATLAEGRLVINADGSYRFDPAPGFDGDVPPVSYTVDDGNGGADSSTLSIEVQPANSPEPKPPLPPTPEPPAQEEPRITVDHIIDEVADAQFSLEGTRSLIAEQHPILTALNDIQALGGTAELPVVDDGYFTGIRATGPIGTAVHGIGLGPIFDPLDFFERDFPMLDPGADYSAGHLTEGTIVTAGGQVIQLYRLAGEGETLLRLGAFTGEGARLAIADVTLTTEAELRLAASGEAALRTGAALPGETGLDITLSDGTELQLTLASDDGGVALSEPRAQTFTAQATSLAQNGAHQSAQLLQALRRGT
ncbi:MAG: cadherin-like domain-containing protein [Silicimonas sp.]|nr:cadherin-like domain-containing protein [Silicimonas sp.]